MPQILAPRPAHAILLALVLSALLSGPALAERADRDQPMNIESDALRYDDTRQTSVFTGNVVVTKGTIVIRGGQLDVRQDPQGNQFGTVMAAGEALAFFRQKRQGVDEYIEGEAQRIEYDSQADTVKFIGRALLRRYKGSQLNDETRGSVILFDNKTEVFTVDGGPGSRTPTNPSGRVRAILTPTGASPAAPALPAPAPLQPSLRLEPRQ